MDERSHRFTDRGVSTFREEVLLWYKQHGRDFLWRRGRLRTYHVVITEELLQRTSAPIVNRFLPSFLQRFPDWRALAEASESEIRHVLVPVGLWRRRAKMFSKLAREVVHHNGRLPQDRRSLEELPGVGQYVASAILLMRNGRREPLLDASMARLLERYFGPGSKADFRFDSYLQGLAREILSTGNPRDLNWGMLDLSAAVCRATRPLCHSCPLSGGCQHFLNKLPVHPHAARSHTVR
ncbi:MAG: hypothetical protein JRN54_04725 [Nitrososphaerota archaeon]|nr:hypothetical protein [Nitrososphaerota archaeon]